jgi:hypothetical protein
MTTTTLNLTRDINGFVTYGYPFTEWNYNTVLAQGVNQTVTAPSENAQWLAIFVYEPGTVVWVADNTAADAPGGSFAKAYSQLNPSPRLVNGGDVLSFVTENVTARLSVSFYAL